MIEDCAILLQVRHDCADVDMVALGPRMLARLNFKGTLHTLQQPLKAPIFSAGIVQTKLSPRARMGSASGDSGDPPPALVLCGPSGAGKSTLMKLLTSEFREQFGFSVSHTTRSPRPGEQTGQDYHFTARIDMEALRRVPSWSIQFSGATCTAPAGPAWPRWQTRARSASWTSTCRG